MISNKQLNLSNLSTLKAHLNLSNLTGPTLKATQPTNKHLNLSNLSGWEGGPCPRSTLKATHQQTNSQSQ